jgi:hypothetical protein
MHFPVWNFCSTGVDANQKNQITSVFDIVITELWLTLIRPLVYLTGIL